MRAHDMAFVLGWQSLWLLPWRQSSANAPLDLTQVAAAKATMVRRVATQIMMALGVI
jgi:hypothetical protein